MLIMTGVILIARALDPGKEAFLSDRFAESAAALDFLFCFGLVTELFVATKSADGSSGGGSLFVIASSFAEFLFLGMIAETVYAIKKSEGAVSSRSAWRSCLASCSQSCSPSI